jgi:hypothetical protein
MPTPESINRLLSVAASLLDHAAAEIRDAKLAPVLQNIEQIGRALAEIFEIQHRIYEVQPELTPEHLKQPSEHSAANRLLTEYMYRASEHERAGNIADAIATFDAFLEIESSPLHRSIAEGEIERLRRPRA